MNTKKQWEELYKMLRGKDWRGAVKSIDSIIDAEPGNPNHYLKKGDICLKAGDKAESLNAYLKAAWYLNKSGFLKKALAVYKMALRYDPDNDEAIRAANKVMMELEFPAQTSGKTEWKEVFTPGESPGETAAISPETGMPEHVLYEQPVEAPLFQMEDLLEPTRYSEKRAEPAVTPETEPVTEPDTEPAAEPLMESVAKFVMEPGTELFMETESSVPLGFLSHFTSDEIEEILHRAELKKFSDKETVVQEGDTGDSIYLIKSGSASVIGHFFGKVIALETLSDGDLFGEVAFLTGRTRTANVVAKGDLEVYEINRLLLDELIEKRPEILSQMNEIYVKRVKDTIRKVKSKK